MTKREAIDMCINTMRPLYEDVVRNARALDAAVGQHFAPLGSAAGASRVLARDFSACGHCDGRLALQQSASRAGGEGGGVFLNCAACNEAHPLPRAVEGAANVRALGDLCAKCNFEKLRLRTVYAPTGEENDRSICPWCQSYRFGGAAARKEMVVPRCEKCNAAAAQLQLGKTKKGGHLCVRARPSHARCQPPSHPAHAHPMHSALARFFLSSAQPHNRAFFFSFSIIADFLLSKSGYRAPCTLLAGTESFSRVQWRKRASRRTRCARNAAAACARCLSR